MYDLFAHCCLVLFDLQRNLSARIRVVTLLGGRPESTRIEVKFKPSTSLSNGLQTVDKQVYSRVKTRVERYLSFPILLLGYSQAQTICVNQT